LKPWHSPVPADGFFLAKRMRNDMVTPKFTGKGELTHMDAKETDAAKRNAAQAQTGPTRMMSGQLSVYYANCVMIATSPRDLSLFFGRFVPTPDEQGGQKLAEVYERQVYMTIEQAEDLANVLNQTVKAFRARREPGENR
jgi:hypothetical protein